MRINARTLLQWPFRKTTSRVGKMVTRFLKRNQTVTNLLFKIDIPHLNATTFKLGSHALQAIRRGEEIQGKFGVNIAGYITAESGVGEGVRANIRALDTAGIPFALNNVDSPSQKGDATYKALLREDHPYFLNLVHVNPFDFRGLLRVRGIGYLVNRYTVGFWYWELSQIPKEWHYCFRYLDEVWVASNFSHEAVSKVSPLPVTKIPPPVVVGKTRVADRPYFSLREDSFVFAFMFDFLSAFERKNPMAVLRAFQIAFKPGENVQLVLKSMNSKQNRAATDKLIQASRGWNVRLIDRYLARDEVNALTALCDCYVSLHRAEGFGLPLAEAMYLGKPVIATAYSSNMDFMNSANSFPVKYRLVEIADHYGPYKKGNLWAEPDIDHAAELMRLVYEDRALAKRVGEKASSDIKREFSPEATGTKILSRLEQIVKEKRLEISR